MKDDPTARRRLDRERQNAKDTDVWRRRRAGQSFRQIARALGLPGVSAVQRCYERASRRRAELAPLSVDVGMTAEDAADHPSRWHTLNPLERWRLRHIIHAPAPLPPIHDDDHARCCIAHGIDPYRHLDEPHGALSHPWPRARHLASDPGAAGRSDPGNAD